MTSGLCLERQTTTSKGATPNRVIRLHHFLHLQAQQFFLLGLRGFRISPNLVSRLAADFALCYQLQDLSNRGLANQCLKDAETFCTREYMVSRSRTGGG